MHIVLGRVPHGTRILLHRTLDLAVILLNCGWLFLRCSIRFIFRIFSESRPSVQLYVDRFNPGDWDGVRELTSADAWLNVAERLAGKICERALFLQFRALGWKIGTGRSGR